MFSNTVKMAHTLSTNLGLLRDNHRLQCCQVLALSEGNHHLFEITNRLDPYGTSSRAQELSAARSPELLF